MDMNFISNRSLSISNYTMQSILLVDDEASNLHVLGQVLGMDYKLYFARSGEKAIEMANQLKPDLILLDVMMPGTSGYDVARVLRQDKATMNIPIIFVTAMSDVENETLGFDAGAVDYIVKPLNGAIVRARVRTHLSLVKTEELNRTQLEIIRCLGHAAEYKDNETGLHVIRMSHYSRILGEAIGLGKTDCELLLNAAPMHDIGKIGIPDSILLKPGKLDQHEWDVMRGHPYMGARIIGDQDSPLLNLAASIAYTHHEKWNGTGYPRGLKGEAIPLEGRIVAIADVFDALTTVRPYKPAWPVEKAIAMIRDEAGTHFDPDLVPLFLDELSEVLEVRERWLDSAEPQY